MFSDPTRSFLISSAWSGLLTNPSHAIDFIELLSPDTDPLEALTEQQLEELEQDLGMQIFETWKTSATDPTEIKSDRIALIRDKIKEIYFEQILDISRTQNFEETFKGKPIEDLNRLLLNIPVLQGTVLQEKRLVLNDGAGNDVKITYFDTNEEFITFDSIILHVRTYELRGKLYLNSMDLYCNWKPLNELGEIVLDRLFTPNSDYTKNSDGIYAFHANVTNGAILKLVLLLKTGTNVNPWQHQPNWKLLSFDELQAVLEDAQAESDTIQSILSRLPEEVKKLTINSKI